MGNPRLVQLMAAIPALGALLVAVLAAGLLTIDRHQLTGEVRQGMDQTMDRTTMF